LLPIGMDSSMGPRHGTRRGLGMGSRHGTLAGDQAWDPGRGPWHGTQPEGAGMGSRHGPNLDRHEIQALTQSWTQAWTKAYIQP
jgi:hypothetical protein